MKIFFVFVCLMSISKFSHALDINTVSAVLYGPTGFVTKPSASTLNQGMGNIGVWESFDDGDNDNFYFLYGVRNWLELGVRTDIPSQDSLNFVFKINSGRQDRLFKGFPLLAFGIYRSKSYFTASYQISPLMATIGTNLSDSNKGIFAGASLQLSKYALVQADIEDRNFGLGLRGQFKNFQLSLLYDGNLDQNIVDAKIYWGLGFSF